MFILILGSCRIPYFKMCLFDTIVHSISLGFIRDKHWDTEVKEQILVWTLSSQNGEQKLGMLGSCSNHSVTIMEGASTFDMCILMKIMLWTEFPKIFLSI